jgi:hypothetical protein
VSDAPAAAAVDGLGCSRGAVVVVVVVKEEREDGEGMTKAVVRGKEARTRRQKRSMRLPQIL